MSAIPTTFLPARIVFLPSRVVATALPGACEDGNLDDGDGCKSECESTWPTPAEANAMIARGVEIITALEKSSLGSGSCIDVEDAADIAVARGFTPRRSRQRFITAPM